MRKLKPIERMLVHLLKGKCKYYTGSMTTYIGENIQGNVNWLNNLWFGGYVQTSEGVFDINHPSGNMYFNMPHNGDEIWLTEKGETRARKLALLSDR